MARGPRHRRRARAPVQRPPHPKCPSRFPDHFGETPIFGWMDGGGLTRRLPRKRGGQGEVIFLHTYGFFESSWFKYRLGLFSKPHPLSHSSRAAQRNLPPTASCFIFWCICPPQGRPRCPRCTSSRIGCTSAWRWSRRPTRTPATWSSWSSPSSPSAPATPPSWASSTAARPLAPDPDREDSPVRPRPRVLGPADRPDVFQYLLMEHEKLGTYVFV